MCVSIRQCKFDIAHVEAHSCYLYDWDCITFLAMTDELDCQRLMVLWGTVKTKYQALNVTTDAFVKYF